jgi:hypothetical protein
LLPQLNQLNAIYNQLGIDVEKIRANLNAVFYGNFASLTTSHVPQSMFIAQYELLRDFQYSVKNGQVPGSFDLAQITADFVESGTLPVEVFEVAIAYKTLIPAGLTSARTAPQIFALPNFLQALRNNLANTNALLEPWASEWLFRLWHSGDNKQVNSASAHNLLLQISTYVWYKHPAFYPALVLIHQWNKDFVYKKWDRNSYKDVTAGSLMREYRAEFGDQELQRALSITGVVQ